MQREKIKMPKSHFIPKRDGDFDMFEENFSNKISIHAPSLGLDPTEVTVIRTAISNHRMAYSGMLSKRTESKSASEDNFQKKLIAKKELRRISRQIKALRGYTSAIGDDLGIIGSDTPEKDITELKPLLIAKMNGQEIVIKFKKEDTDGIRLYSRRGSETEFTLLAVDTHSPYNDNRPKLDGSKPEQREYYAFFFEGDIEIGKRSDVIKAVVS